MTKLTVDDVSLDQWCQKKTIKMFKKVQMLTLIVDNLKILPEVKADLPLLKSLQIQASHSSSQLDNSESISETVAKSFMHLTELILVKIKVNLSKMESIHDALLKHHMNLKDIR